MPQVLFYLPFFFTDKRNQCTITGLAIKSGAMQDTVILKILLKNLHRPELSYQAVFCFCRSFGSTLKMTIEWKKFAVVGSNTNRTVFARKLWGGM
ncbi:MAG: hypothetical protein U5K71_03570 [Gracilimonas sp.]|nr:hypothetical protein [Gracilimonas sp.]